MIIDIKQNDTSYIIVQTIPLTNYVNSQFVYYFINMLHGNILYPTKYLFTYYYPFHTWLVRYKLNIILFIIIQNFDRTKIKITSDV